MGKDVTARALFKLIEKLVQRRGLTRIEADEILAILNQSETKTDEETA